MKVVLQRTARAAVEINGRETREIGPGLVLLAGVAEGDTPQDARLMARKCVQLRIFEDEEGKLNKNLLDTGGSVLAISNFTLCADTRKGRRPSFTGAARPPVSTACYEAFLAALKEEGAACVETGEFGADMKVSLVNDGPVTLTLDTGDWKKEKSI